MKKGIQIIRNIFPMPAMGGKEHYLFFQFGHFFETMDEDKNYESTCLTCGIKRRYEIIAYSYNNKSVGNFYYFNHNDYEYLFSDYIGDANKIITCEEYIIKSII